MQRAMLLVPFALLLCRAAVAQGEPAATEDQSPTSTHSWCDDSGTYCWNPELPVFNGVRVLAEPRLGAILTLGDDKLKSEPFNGAIGLGVEVNIFKAFASLQAFVLSPFQAEFDADSPSRTNVRNADGKLDVEYGFAFGVSFLDGVFASGYGTLHFDRRDFLDRTLSDENNKFFYINFQVVSAARAVIKNLK